MSGPSPVEERLASQEPPLVVVRTVWCIFWWQKRALVVRGPSEVRSKEVVFMQFSSNETGEDFSAISYMIFADFSDLIHR